MHIRITKALEEASFKIDLGGDTITQIVREHCTMQIMELKVNRTPEYIGIGAHTSSDVDPKEPEIISYTDPKDINYNETEVAIVLPKYAFSNAGLYITLSSNIKWKLVVVYCQLEGSI